MSYRNGNKIPDFTRENIERPPMDRRDFYHAPEESREHQEAPKPEAPRSEEPKPTGYKCNVCGYECATERGIQTHIGKSHKAAGKADAKE